MAQIRILRISRARFDALTYAKHPYAELTGQEVEWYKDSRENVLGALVLDLVDHDWSWVVLGRDEAGLFRAIDFNVSVPRRNAAREILKARMREHSRGGASEFPQYDVSRKKNVLFDVVVDQARLSKHFTLLANTPHHQAARGIIREIGYALADVDGNFVEQFQSSAFNARLFELYIFAFLHEQKVLLDRSFNRPDFVGNKFGFEFCLEAATINPSEVFSEPPPENPDTKRAR